MLTCLNNQNEGLAMKLFLLTIFCLNLFASEIDLIIPTPKKLQKLNRSLSLQNCQIILIGNDIQLTIAADEINHKITSLGGTPLTISKKILYKVIFKEEDMVEPVSSEKKFNLQEYYDQPHLYRSIFQQYIRRLSILMNCIYWDKQYPRLVTKEFLEENLTGQLKLQVIGDISVDINGAIEFTEKATSPDNPVFVYNPIRDDVIEGFRGNGIVVMAVDNLPCELPKESSQAFSDSLLPFIPSITKADYSVNFEYLELPSEIKKAVILYHGKLTPSYQYINRFL